MSEALLMARELVRILEEKEKDEKIEKEDKVELSSLTPGEVFKIGEHDFIVLEQKQEQTMVISKWFMANARIFDSNNRDYNKSCLKNLIEHDVDLTSVDMQNEFGSCRCKVRLITFNEARKYNDLLENKDLDNWWWTCTPWSTEERGWKYSITVISSYGDFACSCRDAHLGVRPICILKSNIFVSKQ